MDYVKPMEVIENITQVAVYKSRLTVKEILVKGALSGAFLGYSTTLAFTAAIQTKLDIVGALIFPAGFVIILLLGLELVTGNFAMLPIAVLRKETTTLEAFYSFFWAFWGNLLGSLFYALLYVIFITKFWHIEDSDMIQRIIQVAESKTLSYQKIGIDGMIVVFVKALLCNWMVTLGAVMAFTSHSTVGKIAAMWLPVFIFFGQGFEHAVVNMFVIPAGMLLGADITWGDWWIWNQIPVTLGNLMSGAILTGLALHYITKKKETKQKLEPSSTENRTTVS